MALEACWPKLIVASALATALASRAAPAEPAGAAVRPRSAAESLLGEFSLRATREPISVRADSLEFSYKEKAIRYSGNVSVTQGDVTLRGQVLTVTFDADSPDRLRQIVAEGGVEITQGARSARGQRAVFDQQQRTIQLSEGAELTDGPNRVTGERVIVYLDEERSVVEGGDQRVQAVLFPEHGKGGDAPREEPRSDE